MFIAGALSAAKRTGSIPEAPFPAQVAVVSLGEVVALITMPHSLLTATVIVAPTVNVAAWPCPAQMADALKIRGLRTVTMSTMLSTRLNTCHGTIAFEASVALTSIAVGSVIACCIWMAACQLELALIHIGALGVRP